MASRPSVGIRLGLDGKDEVKNGFAEIADSGDAATKRIVSQWEKAGDEVERAMERQQAAASKIQALMTTPTQSLINANAGTTARGGYRDAGGGDAQAQNATASQYAALLQQQEARADALRAAVDPLYAAQKRYDDEVRVANGLFAQGAISEATHAAALKQSEAALNSAKRGVEGHSSALGLNSIQLQVGTASVHRFADSVLAGTSPMRAFMMQAGDVATVLQTDDGGVAGGLAKVRALLTPTNVALGATAAVLAVGAAAWYEYSDAIGKLQAVSQGAGAVLGQTGEQLVADAQAAAQAGNISVSTATDIEKGYLGVAKSGDVLVGLTAITKDFAAATGVDMKAAQAALTAAFSDPIAGADQLADKYGMLSQAQTEHIAKLIEEGQNTEAQIELLRDVREAVDGAADHVTGLARAWDVVKTSVSNAFTATGKYLNQYGPGMVFDLTGIPLAGTFGNGTGPQPRQNDAAANQARARAQALAAQYEGDGRDKIQTTISTLRAGIAAGGAPDQVKQWTEALAANEHALNTWMPAQEKASKLASLDAQIAAAKTPAQKAALAAQKEEVELNGKVVTAADAASQAHAKGAAALATASKAGAGHAATLARDAAAMDASAKAALGVGEAYLQSSAAGTIAEARRKALTDATKSGADAEAQVRRQMAVTVADAIVAGDKGTAQLRDETEARTKELAAVAAHTMGIDGLNDALSDQAALQPLLAAQLNAQPGQMEAATKAVIARTQALNDNHAAMERISALQATHSTDNNIMSMRDQADFAGDRSIDAAAELARRQAERDAEQKYGHLAQDDPTRQGFVDNQVAAARTKFTTDNVKYFSDQKTAQANALEMGRQELALTGATDAKRSLILNHLKEEQALRARGVDLSSEEARNDLAAVDAQSKLDAALKQSQDSMSELKDIGGQFIDTVFNPNGNILKSLLKEVEVDLIKLAAINPLKNLLGMGGGGLPTLSSIFRLFGGGGGGGSVFDSAGDLVGSTAPASMAISPIHFAAGTEYSSAGAAVVGESGPELLNLPQGTRVTNASDTRRMLSAANDGKIVVQVQANDYFDAKVSRISGTQIQSAAPHIAAGGSQMAQKSARDFQRRKLGTRG